MDSRTFSRTAATFRVAGLVRTLSGGGAEIVRPEINPEGEFSGASDIQQFSAPCNTISALPNARCAHRFFSCSYSLAVCFPASFGLSEIAQSACWRPVAFAWELDQDRLPCITNGAQARPGKLIWRHAHTFINELAANNGREMRTMQAGNTQAAAIGQQDRFPEIASRTMLAR
jgi:hypothetical protein